MALHSVCVAMTELGMANFCVTSRGSSKRTVPELIAAIAACIWPWHREPFSGTNAPSGTKLEARTESTAGESPPPQAPQAPQAPPAPLAMMLVATVVALAALAAVAAVAAAVAMALPSASFASLGIGKSRPSANRLAGVRGAEAAEAAEAAAVGPAQAERTHGS
ncbi:unnamed protein product [Effrenium voratum]|nr:unnamed protein product [Effrenium voratum]